MRRFTEARAHRYVRTKQKRTSSVLKRSLSENQVNQVSFLIKQLSPAK